MSLFTYIGFAVAWQGVFAAGISLWWVAERLVALREKGPEPNGPPGGLDLVMERFKVMVLPPWLALTALGFIGDAVSSPPFEQARGLVGGDAGFIVACASIAGCICCLAWGFYKLGRAIPFVLRNKGRPTRERPFVEIEDADLGSVRVVQMSFDCWITGKIDINGKPVNFEIKYPSGSKIPDPSVEATRELALKKGKRFIAMVNDLEPTLRTRTAEIFVEFRALAEPGRSLNSTGVAGKLELNCIECVFDGEKLGMAHLALRYSNATGLGDREVRVLVALSKVIGGGGSGGMLSASELARLGEEDIAAVNDSREIVSNDDLDAGKPEVWFE